MTITDHWYYLSLRLAPYTGV